MFKRKIYDELLNWKNKYNGTRALLIEGARRVGKSTIALEFAKSEYDSFIFIDFANVKKEVINIFDDISDLDLFFLRLQAEFNVNLVKRKSIIVFDEIQFFPKARQAIKYLVQDGRYDYLETGSLISIKKNVRDILIPSEELKIEMYPLDYEEFSNAVGLNYQLLKDLYNLKKPIGEEVNRKLIRDFRTYIAIGGMPQAVSAYIEKKSFDQIDEIKKSIIDLYISDLKKIDSSGRLSKIYESIPSQLFSKRNRFSFHYATNSNKNKKDEERIFDLLDSKIANSCYKITDPSISFSQSTDLTQYKFYLSDTGLFVTMLFNSDNNSHEDLYKKLISNKLDLNLGYLYENVISQLIVSSRRKLFYYFWNKENSTHKYEIDFLIYNKNKILPIEIKSNKTHHHQSLDQFAIKYSHICGNKYIFSTKDYQKEKDTFYIPFSYYMSIIIKFLYPFFEK